MDPLTAWKPIRSETTRSLQGACSCGKVQLTLPAGTPILSSSYCHCNSCRKWTGCPVTMEFGVPGAALDFPERGNDLLKTTKVTEAGPNRHFCAACGTAMYCYHEPLGMYFIHHAPFSGAIEEIPATCHSVYEDKVISIKDGLPKYKFFPPMMEGMEFEMMEE